MESRTSVEIIKKGKWFHPEYQVQSRSGEKLYSIRNESDAGSNRAVLNDACADEIGSLQAGITGLSFLYHAKLKDGKEEKIEIRHNGGKRIYELSKYGLRFEKKLFSEKYDIFGENSKRGKLFPKSGRYILELDGAEDAKEGNDLLVPMLFLFMAVKECECAC